MKKTTISRRSFLKAAGLAAAAASLALTGCSSASSAASGGSAAGGAVYKVGIVNYVDDASLNQIVASLEARLDEAGAERGVTFNYADYYANAQADQSNLNQIGADLVADGVDVIVAVATPSASTMLAAVEDTDIPVIYSAVTDPVGAGFDGLANITGTSDALDTEAIMNLILAVNPGIDQIGLLYDLGQDSSTQAIADAKAFCEAHGIGIIEKNGTTTAEVQMAVEALAASGVKAVFTPTDNTIMTAELAIYETLIEAGSSWARPPPTWWWSTCATGWPSPICPTAPLTTAPPPSTPRPAPPLASTSRRSRRPSSPTAPPLKRSPLRRSLPDAFEYIFSRRPPVRP